MAWSRSAPRDGVGLAELVVEAGTLSVRIDGFVADEQAIDEVHIDAVVGQGERLALTPGVVHAVRNDGPTLAVVLVIATGPPRVRAGTRAEPGGDPVPPPRLAAADPVACGAGG